MKIAVITKPEFFEGEAACIDALFASGLELLHLRKPSGSESECRRLIEAVDSRFRNRIVVHGHFGLAMEYGLYGIHLNSRNPEVPEGYDGNVSISCHSFGELEEAKSKGYSHMFLSPIYDSISKQGYGAAFSDRQLDEAVRNGIIDGKVFALGGIGSHNIRNIRAKGFGGAALLGSVWNSGSLSPESVAKTFNTIMDTLERQYPVVLTIAGSDSSGGAGIQADIKAISALGGFAASVITAVTAQNTCGVRAIHPIPGEIITAQLDAVFEDIYPDAVKIGMVNDPAVVDAIADALKKYRPAHIVYDPVMVATSGSKLMQDETIGYIRDRLIPLAGLITPNLRECEVLYGKDVHDIEEMKVAAQSLSEKFGTAVLVKGGHLDGSDMTDVLYSNGEFGLFIGKKIESSNTHGTGCTLSSSIATLLAKGFSINDAVSIAKRYVAAAIKDGISLNIGKGNGPLWHQTSLWKQNKNQF